MFDVPSFKSMRNKMCCVFPPQQRPTHSKTRGRVPFLKGGRNVRVNTHAYTHHVIWCDRILIHHKMTHQPFILPCQQTVIQFGGTHNTGQLKIRITPIFMRLDVRLDAYPLNEYINSKISTHQQQIRRLVII